jgi:hypothetical protein
MCELDFGMYVGLDALQELRMAYGFSEPWNFQASAGAYQRDAWRR